MSPTNDLKLVQRVLAKDRTAFETFFETYFARLARFCAVRVQQPEAVEDIVQETLVKALRNLHTYRGEALLFSWLCAICRNEISNWYARTGRKQEAMVSLDDNPAIQAALESFALEAEQRDTDRLEILQLVQLTLDYLPDNYGKALEWKYFDGLTVQEIARRLGLGRLATQSLLARARRAFRAAFTDLQQELPL